MPTNTCAPQNYISWKPEYDAPVRLINCQHQEILRFVNNWYCDLKSGQFRRKDLLCYLRERFCFLEHFTRQHLTFEEDMLLLLTRRHGFPEEEYRRHLASHRNFTKSFMGTLSGQIELFATSHAQHVVDTILVDILRDVAGWWFAHIRPPAGGEPGGPDHVYREYLRSIGPQGVLGLLNDLLATAELQA